LVTLDDSAIVVKDAEGKLHVKNQVDRGVLVGAGWGSLIGLLIGGIFMPLGGLAIGAAAGGAIGKMVSNGVDKKFVKDVADKIQPGTSALFLIGRSSDRNAVLAALKPYKGTVLHTSLDSELEESLRRALKYAETPEAAPVPVAAAPEEATPEEAAP
jgi:uncharacterized membrane protein